MKKRLYALITSALLAGCSLPNLTQQQPTATTAPVYQPGEFNSESVYELLVAELAGQQGQFDLALDNYLKQARLTNDPAVAERATRVAQYLRNVEGITESAQLWMQAAPENPEPYQISASILLHQKRFSDAIPLVERALEYDRPRMLAVIRSQITEMPDDVARGYIDLLDELLTEHPDQVDLLVIRGLLYKRLQDNDAALASFNNALKYAPANSDAVAQKAEMLRLRGDLTQALQTLQPALDKQPDNQSLRILYTQLLFQSGRIEEGQQQANLILQNAPKDFQLKLYVALLLLENEQISASEVLFKELLTDTPKDTRPHFYLGAIAQQDGRIDQAIFHFQRVEDPTVIYQAIARISALLDTPEDRQRLGQIVSDLRKNRPELAARLYALEADWLSLHGFNDDALVLMEEALTRFKDDVSLLYTRAMMLEPNDFGRAETDLRRILELDPDNSMALNALGYTLTVHTERYQEAYELITAALQQRPDDAAIIDSMGWVLFKLERYPEAISYLERAYALIPDGEVAGHLIQSYWANGDISKARELLQKSLAKDPTNTHLQEAERVISSP